MLEGWGILRLGKGGSEVNRSHRKNESPGLVYYRGRGVKVEKSILGDGELSRPRRETLGRTPTPSLQKEAPTLAIFPWP